MAQQDDDQVIGRRDHFAWLSFFSPVDEHPDPRGKGKQPALGPSATVSGPNTSSGGNVRVKNFLANERTFLAWAQFSLILGGLGIALVNGASRIGQAAGVLFTLATLMFLAYALCRYYQRADRLHKRESGTVFEDKMGTMLVIVVVLFAVGANLIMKLVELKGK
ncbi:hypothetical protein SeMB42_g06527 [Synchytrium endobioticum]|uniref:DUF202 domain-containing protein n=1 Tax=Synchytrium endobioticum TaxID=286115 RepID=A0A507CH18_9FUNG|nr:hypothetical protein SeLEV6574_g07601 [Synchytrium endobioticum]TPX38990.1 hypothetical protein SeMB42_g06527 [Synchytrium endobioticum]